MVAPAQGWDAHKGAQALLDPAGLTRRLDDGWRASNAWPEAPITVDYVRFGAEQAWVSYRDEDAAAERHRSATRAVCGDPPSPAQPPAAPSSPWGRAVSPSTDGPTTPRCRS